MSDPRAFLNQIPALSSVNPPALDHLGAALIRHAYSAGQMIALEGDDCRSVLIVARGIIRERHLSAEGREYVLAYAAPGRLLNLAPAYDQCGAMASLDALTEVETFEIPCQQFAALSAEHPTLAHAVLAILSDQVRSARIMARDLALYDVRTRLARFLLSNAENSPANQRWTQESIAAHIGTVRDVVGRVLRSFQEQGLVRRERGRMVIVDEERLLAQSEGR